MHPGAIGLLVLVVARQVETLRTQPSPSGLQLVVEGTELSHPDRPEEPARSLIITLFNPVPRIVHGFFVQSMSTSPDGRTSYGGTRRIVHTSYP